MCSSRCFLHLGSAERLFHTAVDDPKHPILMLNCYFDLGPSLTTHCVSGKVRLIQEKNRKN